MGDGIVVGFTGDLVWVHALECLPTYKTSSYLELLLSRHFLKKVLATAKISEEMCTMAGI